MLLREEISRIKEIMLIKEDVGLGDYIDSTYLKTAEQAGISNEESYNMVVKTIQDAIDHNFKLVMIRPEYVSLAREMIDNVDSNVLIGTVIDFPKGDGSLNKKFDESEEAMSNGVDELDYVVDYQAFKRGDIDKVMKEVCEGTLMGTDEGKVVKWIIETAALTDKEVVSLTQLISKIVIECVGWEQASKVFIKTSTGVFQPEDGGPSGATVKDVMSMKDNAGPLNVKASGGVYNKDDLQKMIDAGATRIGTSAAVDIIKGDEVESDY